MTGRVIWFTGLPASGKTTLARALNARLSRLKVASCILDGDSMRHVLAPHLGYSDADRAEFYETLAHLAAELAHQGLVVLVPATAHRRAYRARARQLSLQFIEVWVTTPLAECRRRDPKGLYEAAERLPGRLPGVDVPYEEPVHPDVCATGGEDRNALDRLVSFARRGAAA